MLLLVYNRGYDYRRLILLYFSVLPFSEAVSTFTSSTSRSLSSMVGLSLSSRIGASMNVSFAGKRVDVT